MASVQLRGFRRQVLGKLREYEGQVKRLEGQLLILRGKAERATGEAQEKLGKLLAEVEREAETVRGAGLAALDGLERAVTAGGSFLEAVRGRLSEVKITPPSVMAKGRDALRRAG
ncbi:MAG TPA: hypothetical protein VN648_29485, partial [Candidatus Methylomirabilis sp.]|nr:hypothetical protein [Candidatus Methylomirabilis sp.]